MTGRFDSPGEGSNAEASTKPIVFVVEDDISLRRSLTNLFRSVGLDVVAFGSAREMLQSTVPDVVSCLVLDVRLPGLSGLEYQTELARLNIHIPIIFITGHGDVPMSVRAMKEGAVDFLSKPFRDQELLDAVVAATERDRKRRQAQQTVAKLQSLFETLSPREQAVMKLVAAGLDEQAGSSRAWARRDYGQDLPWTRHEKDACPVAGRLDQND
ncbi:FixJ family two-component response regulator [Bradyrhizobium sp. USDA 3311]